MTDAAVLGTWDVDWAQFGQRLRARLAPGQGERPGRPSDPTWTVQRKFPMSAQTLAVLESLAEQFSTPQRRVSPMQVAAMLVAEAAKAAAEQIESTTDSQGSRDGHRTTT